MTTVLRETRVQNNHKDNKTISRKVTTRKTKTKANKRNLQNYITGQKEGNKNSEDM